MPLFEFTVPGKPVSHQSHNRALLETWRRQVRKAATRRWGTNAPLGGPLRIMVTYYHEGTTTRIDADNLLKPIQDALIGLVYADDCILTDAAVRKTRIDGPFLVRYESLVLLSAFSQGDEFVHVVIEDAPSHQKLLK